MDHRVASALREAAQWLLVVGANILILFRVRELHIRTLLQVDVRTKKEKETASFLKQDLYIITYYIYHNPANFTIPT